MIFLVCGGSVSHFLVKVKLSYTLILTGSALKDPIVGGAAKFKTGTAILSQLPSLTKDLFCELVSHR